MVVRALAGGNTSATVRRLLTLLLLVLGWTVATAAPAAAHAAVTASDPADASRLETAPRAVTITFSEGVSAESGYLKVVNGRGQQVSEGGTTHPNGDQTKITIGLRSGLGDDSYVVSYRIGSADSHPITGAFSFVVGDGPLVAASGMVVGGTTDAVVNWVFTVARYVSFVGIVLYGALAFVVLCWPAGRSSVRARRLIWAGWIGAVVGGVLGLLLEGPYVAGTGLADALDLSLLQVTLGTTYGRMLSGRLLLLGILAFFTVRLLRTPAEQTDDLGVGEDKSRARDEDLSAIVALGVLATYGGVGHAAASAQPTLALLSDTAHLGAVTMWLGGLAVLTTALLPSRRTEELAAALPRFSRIAMGAVAVLALTGIYQAWSQIGPLPALWSTQYGRLLLLKIAGFLLLIGLGNLSRLAVRRRYAMPVAHALSMSDTQVAEDAEEDRMLSRLRRSVAVEVGIGAAVLALTAVLVSTAPAKATYVRPFESTVQLASGGSARVSVTPGRTGANTVEVAVSNSAGEPADPREVSMTATLPAAQIGPLPVTLAKVDTGRYRTTSASFPTAGTWQLVLRVQAGEFDRDVVQVDVPVT